MTIRPYDDSDAEAVIHLSLQAWAPVFASIKQAVASAVYDSFYPGGWRKSQRAAVEAALAEQDVWVAEQDGRPVGFVSVVLHQGDDMGEIHMIAVDPAYQRAGVGMALTEHAVDQMREAGMEVAMVETGGDPGHAAARLMYEEAGFQVLPIARFFKKL